MNRYSHIASGLIICLLLFMMPVLTAGNNTESPDKIIKQANLEYSSGYYDHALELYLSVVDQGYASAGLYYNIGNTYYKLNHIPEAILYYERALKLAPQDENIIFNLEHAQKRTIDKIESIPELFYERWFRSVLNLHNADGWGRLSILFLFLAAALAAAFLLLSLRWQRAASFYLSVLFAVLSLSTLSLAFVQHYQRTTKTEAIIFAPSVAVKSSPSEASVDLFVIHEGTKVRITDQMGEWYEVRIASGSMGWLKSEALEKI